jgi:excisionase family DNA binding protein
VKLYEEFRPEYLAWVNAKQSCYNPKNPSYPSVGGKGIVFCDEWRTNFAKFLTDMGIRPKKHMLERIDLDKDFSASNCRWSTPDVHSTRGKLPYEVDRPVLLDGFDCDNDALLTYAEARGVLRISDCTLRGLVRTGRLKAISCGSKCFRIAKSSINEFCKQSVI